VLAAQFICATGSVASIKYITLLIGCQLFRCVRRALDAVAKVAVVIPTTMLHIHLLYFDLTVWLVLLITDEPDCLCLILKACTERQRWKWSKM